MLNCHGNPFRANMLLDNILTEAANFMLPPQINAMTPIELHVIPDSDTFSLGYILDQSNHLTTFLAVDENGLIDSLELIPNHMIDHIVTDSAYLNYYLAVIHQNVQLHLVDPFQIRPQTLPQFETLSALLTFCLNHHRLVTIITADQNVQTGLITMATATQISLEMVDYEPVALKQQETIALTDILIVDYQSIELTHLQHYLQLDH